MMESWSEIMETGATPPVNIYAFLKWLPERWFGKYVTHAKAIGAGMDSLYSDILGKVEARIFATAESQSVVYSLKKGL